MHATLRPYAAAGVVIAGAGLTAATPMPAAPNLPASTARAVQLTGAWQEVFNTTSDNAATLMNNYYLAPGVAFQQLLANQIGYWDRLLDDPAGSSNAINEQIQLHLNAVLTGFGLQNTTSETHATVLNHTMDDTHQLMFGQVAGYLPDDIDPKQIMPIIEWLGSPASAVMMGMIGPGISPWIALMNSINEHDSVGDTLANMVGAFFNGATLNLDSLLPMINDAGFFPAGMSMDHLDFAFGGLLSPGAAAVGPYQVLGPGGEVAASVPAVGGSIFQSVGIELSGVPAMQTLELNSAGIGPIGAWMAWGQTVGAFLGSGWDGKGAVVVTPPLAGVGLPTLPIDPVDDGGMPEAAGSIPDVLQDISALFS